MFLFKIFSFSLSLFLQLHSYNVLLMRIFRRLDVSNTEFNRFKNSKSQQVVLNRKTAILSDYLYVRLVICTTSVLPLVEMKKSDCKFSFHIKFVSSCNSFLYSRFRFYINNFRTIVLHECFSYLLLLDRQPAKP